MVVYASNTIITDDKEKRVNTKNWIDSNHERDYWRAHANAALFRISQAMELV